MIEYVEIPIIIVRIFQIVIILKYTHVMGYIIYDGVVGQVGGQQESVDVFRLEALHIGFGEVCIEISSDVFVAGREFETGCEVAYALV